jgi:hypothetical protein
VTGQQHCDGNVAKGKGATALPAHCSAMGVPGTRGHWCVEFRQGQDSAWEGLAPAALGI